MDISPEKQAQLAKRMVKLGISESDFEEKFILGSGSGGQKVNKTNSCVYLKHLPTGFEVKCQDSRSREMNRFFARRRLCEQIEEKVFKEKSKRRQAMEKIRRQKRKRSKRAKEKMLKDKAKQGEKKVLRRKPEVN